MVHRLRRWPNIDQILVQCIVFAGIGDANKLERWPSITAT